MTLLFVSNLSTAWGTIEGGVTVVRRGNQGRGRARNRGRVYRAFWFVAAVIGSGWV